jgi:hypothetical protein
MKPYRITKIIFAENLAEAFKNEPKAELVEIQLNEEVERPVAGYGFKK